MTVVLNPNVLAKPSPTAVKRTAPPPVEPGRVGPGAEYRAVVRQAIYRVESGAWAAAMGLEHRDSGPQVPESMDEHTRLTALGMERDSRPAFALDSFAAGARAVAMGLGGDSVAPQSTVASSVSSDALRAMVEDWPRQVA